MKGRLALLCALIALVVAVPQMAVADSGARSYVYLVAADFLCGLDPDACPAVAQAPNGDTVEVTGEGPLTIHPKSAGGGGAFVHKDPDGNVLGFGTWSATKLLGFHSYGDGTPQGLPSFLEGGRLELAVEIDPGAPGGPTLSGTMWIDCLVGDRIPAGAVEGIRLSIPGVVNFNKAVGGFTVFVRTG